MVGAGREPLRARGQCDAVETIASRYLVESGGDAQRALRRVVADALADLLEWERGTRRAERLLSRGYVGGWLEQGR